MGFQITMLTIIPSTRHNKWYQNVHGKQVRSDVINGNLMSESNWSQLTITNITKHIKLKKKKLSGFMNLRNTSNKKSNNTKQHKKHQL